MKLNSTITAPIAVNGTQVLLKVTVKDGGFDRETSRAKKARVYLHGDGESIIDDLFNRHNRPATQLRGFVAQILRDAGVRFDSLRWSQYAGCSCPCSPGWILEGSSHNSKIYHATYSAS